MKWTKVTKNTDEIAEDGTRNENIDAAAVTEPANPRHRWLWILLSLVVLASVLYVLSIEGDTIEIAEANTPPPLQLVSVEEVSVTPQQVDVRSFAEVHPRWSAELSAAVSGRVSNVFDSALTGEPVEAGTQLIEIENSRFVAELAAAEHALKESRLALWQAKNATLLAREDFKRNHRKPPNDLALKLPQLEIAESAVVSAEARVAAAKKQLADTMIVAPFAAYVADRFISPGQSVNPGDRLVKLVDKSAFELVVELGRGDWALLRKPIDGQNARILDHEGRVIAQAKVRRGGGFLDEKTRQYKVFLEIENPESGSVLSGDFVTVLLPGVVIDEALNIPSSALTQEGYFWHLDDDDRLQRIEPEVLFRRHDRVVVKAPEGSPNWRVAVTPLVSFLPGQKARPQFEEN